MIWQKIGNSVSDRLFRDSVIAQNQCLYINRIVHTMASLHQLSSTGSRKKLINPKPPPGTIWGLSTTLFLHDWCNKGCGMMHIKEPLLLIRKSSPCGGSGFPLSLSEWSFTFDAI